MSSYQYVKWLMLFVRLLRSCTATRIMLSPFLSSGRRRFGTAALEISSALTSTPSAGLKVSQRNAFPIYLQSRWRECYNGLFAPVTLGVVELFLLLIATASEHMGLSLTSKPSLMLRCSFYLQLAQA